MEFGEKLCALRKSKNLTQEELAQALYVSRTAISKWESGRGYPSIDSIKEISGFFSVSIDELLSGEKILLIAEKENRYNIQNLCGLLFGMADLLYLALVFLPLYSAPVNGYVYAVNLFRYLERVSPFLTLYWIPLCVLPLLGCFEMAAALRKKTKGQKKRMTVSVIIGAAAVFAASLTREAYAVAVVFLIFVLKGILFTRYIRMGHAKKKE